jgi:orotate phosphoribosyltransferase
MLPISQYLSNPKIPIETVHICKGRNARYSITKSTLMSSKEKQILNEGFAKTLLKIDAIRIGTFETHDGKYTPYFIDLKNVSSFPSAFSLSVDCLEFAANEIGRSYEFGGICGVPVSGLVFASALAYKMQKPLVFPVSKQPEKGVRGFLVPGTRVIVIDGVSETGISMKSSILSVRAAGGVVEHALTLIDRMENAAKLLKSEGVQLHSFTTIKELESSLKDKMAISEEEERAIESSL